VDGLKEMENILKNTTKDNTKDITKDTTSMLNTTTIKNIIKKHHRRHRHHHRKHKHHFKFGRCFRHTLRKLKKHNKKCPISKRNFLRRARKSFGNLKGFQKANKHKKATRISKMILKTLKHTALKHLFAPIVGCRILPRRLRHPAHSILFAHQPKRKGKHSFRHKRKSHLKRHHPKRKGKRHSKRYHKGLVRGISRLLLGKKHHKIRHHKRHHRRHHKRHHKKHHKVHHKKEKKHHKKGRKHHKKGRRHHRKGRRHHRGYKGCPCACKVAKKLSHFLVRKISKHKRHSHKHRRHHKKRRSHSTKTKSMQFFKAPDSQSQTSSSSSQSGVTFNPSKSTPHSSFILSKPSSPIRPARVTWVD